MNHEHLLSAGRMPLTPAPAQTARRRLPVAQSRPDCPRGAGGGGGGRLRGLGASPRARVRFRRHPCGSRVCMRTAITGAPCGRAGVPGDRVTRASFTGTHLLPLHVVALVAPHRFQLSSRPLVSTSSLTPTLFAYLAYPWGVASAHLAYMLSVVVRGGFPPLCVPEAWKRRSPLAARSLALPSGRAMTTRPRTGISSLVVARLWDGPLSAGLHPSLRF